MPTEIVTQTQQCPYCLLPTVAVTVEQLLSTRGEVVASTVIYKGACTNAECIGLEMTSRQTKAPRPGAGP